MFQKIKFWMIAGIALLLFAGLLPVQNTINYVASAFYESRNLKINLTLVNPEIKALASDPSNKLVVRAEVKNTSGIAVSNIQVKFTVSGSLGEIYPPEARTNKYGECLVTYIPPPYAANRVNQVNADVTLTAGIYNSGENSSVTIALVRTPLVFIHGYQANGDIYTSMKEYLSSKGFEGNALSYNSQNGVISASKELESFLDQQERLYLSRGIQVKKFDIIAHSMGGLVSRYYTCGQDYIKRDNVRKIIFLSVPHKGSHWASLGIGYFNDQGIKDLTPDSPLLANTFPSMLNRGLNNNIQTANITGQFDEVVSGESASLEEWNIKTEVFGVGENNFTVDRLLDGSIVEATNHKAILNNKKVFERIVEMLDGNLPFPAVKK